MGHEGVGAVGRFHRAESPKLRTSNANSSMASLFMSKVWALGSGPMKDAYWGIRLTGTHSFGKCAAERKDKEPLGG